MSPRGKKLNEQMRAEAKAEISRAALEVFAEYGYHGTTMRQIQQRSGVSKGLVYHYFPSNVSEGSHYQLFNLALDPFEQQNRAATEPVELGRLMRGLSAALTRHNALYPVDQDGAPLKPILPQRGPAATEQATGEK